MSDLNKAILIGRFTHDPELKYTQSGTSVCTFSIASNKTWTNKDGEKKEQVSFFNIVAWQKTGEVIAEYCKKGDRIGIEGHLQQRSWENDKGEKRQTVEIIVDTFQFLNNKPNGDKPPDHTDEDAPRGKGAMAGGEEVSDVPPMTDDNPFSDEDIPM